MVNKKITNIIDEISTQELKKPVSKPFILTLKYSFLIISYFALVIFMSHLRSDVEMKFHDKLFIVELILMMIVALTALYSAVCLSLPDDFQRSWIRFLPFLPLLGLFFMIFKGFLQDEDALTLSQCLALGRYDCILHIFAFSIVPALFLFYQVSKMMPLKTKWEGGLIGLSASAFGYVAMRLVTQRSEDATSILIWHLAPIILIAIIGLQFGKILFEKKLYRIYNKL